MRSVFCDSLGRMVRFKHPPERIVSLVSGFTESLFAMGCGHRVVGVSAYCVRYVPDLKAEVVGDYLKVNRERLRALQPDLIVLTTGVQRHLAQTLFQEGWPVFVLPLASSIYGVWESIITLGGLVGDLRAARELVERWQAAFTDLARRTFRPRPRVYVELWFGRHPRVPGGLTFIHDLIEIAGGHHIFGAHCGGYLPLNLEAVIAYQPEVMVLFSEPEYPVEASDLLRVRGWDAQLPDLRVIASSIRRGQNVIHDGPSMIETATWLHQCLAEVVS